MAKKKEHNGPDPKLGPKTDEKKTNDSWSGATGSDSIPELPDQSNDRLSQMRHGDESAETERTQEEAESAAFFEPLDVDQGADARRKEGE